jgi:serine protease inhibitor
MKRALALAIACMIVHDGIMADRGSPLAPPYNELGFKLLGELAREAPTRNLLISPISIGMALAMAYNGSAGQTRDEMGRALGFEPMSLEQINRANDNLLDALSSSGPKIELTLANSLWARSGIRFKPDFLDRSRRYFRAQVAELDFRDPQSPQTINRWVSQATRNKIQKIIEQISPNAVMFLINAVHFKGRWEVEFDRAKTAEGVFRLADGRQKRVPMMSGWGSYPYLRGDGFQAVSMHYGGRSVSFYLFLPDEPVGLEVLLSKLNRENWDRWMRGFKKMEGEIRMPRFKSECERELKPALSAAGIRSAFDPSRADFSELRTERDVFISGVRHKAVVEVNEEGTEAAAVTSVVISITSARAGFSLVVDRPFLFAIREERTGVILFLGAILDPQ